jgi:hypothetical protein
MEPLNRGEEEKEKGERGRGGRRKGKGSRYPSLLDLQTYPRASEVFWNPGPSASPGH